MLLLSYSALFQPSFASVYQLPTPASRVIGEPTVYQIVSGDFFQKIAEYHDVGLLALIAANPKVDPFLPPVGTNITIPTQMLLPFADRTGVVINLSELRLYYFPPNEKLVYVFPVGIGRQGLSTPKVTTTIGDKRKNPTWTPTQAMRERYLSEHGVELPNVVPAGPNNPFGKYALRLGTSEYLIHGTNKRMGVGMRASSGCIRLFAQDIEWLYHNVAVGTQVKIIDQPIKMSYEKNGVKLIEIHQPLSEQGDLELDDLPDAVNAFLSKNKNENQWLSTLLKHPDGLVKRLK